MDIELCFSRTVYTIVVHKLLRERRAVSRVRERLANTRLHIEQVIKYNYRPIGQSVNRPTTSHNDIMCYVHS